MFVARLDYSFAHIPRPPPHTTFYIAGLMPGTEYQFRLRAFSNGSWQLQEEAVVSSPFKTICSPPDPPPCCPRARQLQSDPIVPGGLAETGAVLDGIGIPRKSSKLVANTSARTSVDRGSAEIGQESVVATAEEAIAAAVIRGEDRAKAENTRKLPYVIGKESNHRHGSEGIKADGDRERSNGKNGRESGKYGDSKREDIHVLSGVGTGGGYVEKATAEAKGDRIREGSKELVPSSGAKAGSSSLTLEWDAGCSNGAMTTNYEVGRANEQTRLVQCHLTYMYEAI